MTAAVSSRSTRPVLAVLAFWSVVALLAAVADYSDQAAANPALRFGSKLALYGAVFLPFALFSTALALLFERRPDLLRPRRLLLLYLGALLLFLPIYSVYETAAVLTLEGQNLPGPLALFLQASAWNRWLDALMVTIAMAVQGAYAYWKHGQQEALASRAAERANLALRLSLLQGQLEPAFLLGALDGIADLVLQAERSQATRALARLSDLLRHALRASQKNWISVADEVSFLRDYVELQVLRFGERVQVEWDLGHADWHTPLCPPLLLHAMFDHAIGRCLETHAAAGPVHAAFSHHGGRLRVLVSHPQGAGPVDPGLAMGELRDRLALLYRGDASLVYSAAGERIVGVLDLPAREDADD